MDESRKDKYKRLVDATSGFTFQKITNVNHRPHPFVIGPKHIEHASKSYNGMFNDEVCKAVPCAYPGCKVSFENHTWDLVLFISLKRDMSNVEANEQLKAVAVDMLADGIDGFTLVETEEKFRIK